MASVNLANRSFRNNLTGETVRVIDSFEDIAILEDRNRVDARHLVNPGLFTEVESINENNENNVKIENGYFNQNVEEVIPENFFSNQGAYNALASKIQSIPEHMIKDDPNAGQTMVRIDNGDGNTSSNFDQHITNESAIVMKSEDEERAELARKYGIVNPTESINKQNEAFSKLLNEDEDTEQVERVEVSRDKVEQQQVKEYNQPIQNVFTEDPIIKMFKGVKRIVDFNISIDISNKIPRIDFIEMMEDSYETSIIDFLADEFTNNILCNPDAIRNMIKDKINQVVYSGKLKDVVKSEELRPTTTSSKVNENPGRRIPSLAKSERVVLSEGVVEKPKRTKRVVKEKKEEVKQ